MDRLIADSLRIQRWLHARSGLPIQAAFHGVAREVDGEIVSAFGFDSFQPKSCALHAGTDRPFTRGLLYKTFEVAFGQWSYDRLYAIIQTNNAKSLNLAVGLGFKEVGKTPDLWFGVLEKEDCRWLIPPKRQHVRRRRHSSGPNDGELDRAGQPNIRHCDI